MGFVVSSKALTAENADRQHSSSAFAGSNDISRWPRSALPGCSGATTAWLSDNGEAGTCRRGGSFHLNAKARPALESLGARIALGGGVTAWAAASGRHKPAAGLAAGFV